MFLLHAGKTGVLELKSLWQVEAFRCNPSIQREQTTDMPTVNDPYQEAREISDLLDGVGQKEYADQLRGALIEGATGSEI